MSIDPNCKTLLSSLLIALLALIAPVAPAQEANEAPSYNATLDGFSYPFPVKKFQFESQRQSVEMAYMYLEPETDKPVVLLLHGKNFSGAYWRETAEYLQSQHYGVLMPDQIGFGKSSKPEHYQFSFPQLAQNTRQLIDELGIEKVIVVGHSMGGMLATRFTLLYPDITEKLILVNPIGLEDYLDYVQYKSIDFFYNNELNSSPEKVKAYQQKNYYDGKWKPEFDPWVEMQAGWINGPDWKQVAWNNALTYDMIFTQPVCNEFGDIQVPTRLIIGTRDRTGPGRGWKREGVDYQLGQYQNLGKQTAEAIPGSKLYELEDLGHLPQIEAFDRFREVFDKALSE